MYDLVGFLRGIRVIGKLWGDSGLIFVEIIFFMLGKGRILVDTWKVYR